jgi:hypothetical protein
MLELTHRAARHCVAPPLLRCALLLGCVNARSDTGAGWRQDTIGARHCCAVRKTRMELRLAVKVCAGRQLFRGVRGKCRR